MLDDKGFIEKYIKITIAYSSSPSVYMSTCSDSAFDVDYNVWWHVSAGWNKGRRWGRDYEVHKSTLGYPSNNFLFDRYCFGSDDHKCCKTVLFKQFGSACCRRKACGSSCTFDW